MENQRATTERERSSRASVVLPEDVSLSHVLSDARLSSPTSLSLTLRYWTEKAEDLGSNPSRTITPLEACNKYLERPTESHPIHTVSKVGMRASVSPHPHLQRDRIARRFRQAHNLQTSGSNPLPSMVQWFMEKRGNLHPLNAEPLDGCEGSNPSHCIGLASHYHCSIEASQVFGCHTELAPLNHCPHGVWV